MNEAIFNFLNSLAIQYPALHSTFAFLANNFGLIVIFILGYFLLVHTDKKRGSQEIILMIIVAIIAWILAHVLKDLFHTARPFVDSPQVLNLFLEETGYAFPSGHATFYSALAAMMWFYHQRIAYALGAVALIIGISRIISGIHWPIDVLGGFVLGITIALITHHFGVRFYKGGKLRELLK